MYDFFLEGKKLLSTDFVWVVRMERTCHGHSQYLREVRCRSFHVVDMLYSFSILWEVWKYCLLKKKYEQIRMVGAVFTRNGTLAVSRRFCLTIIYVAWGSFGNTLVASDTMCLRCCTSLHVAIYYTSLSFRHGLWCPSWQRRKLLLYNKIRNSVKNW